MECGLRHIATLVLSCEEVTTLAPCESAPCLNPLARIEMVIRFDFTGYWLTDLVAILGEEFRWWIRPAHITTVDGKSAVAIHHLAGYCAAEAA